MAPFKVETVSSRPVGCWGSVSIAETVGNCKRAVRYRGCLGESLTPLKEMSVQFITAHLVRVDQFGEGQCIRNCAHRRNHGRFQRVSSIIAKW